MSPNEKIPEDIEFRKDTDILGTLPRREWSCMILDVADKLGPMLGKEGMELYFYTAQLIEGAQVVFGGEGEEQLRKFGTEEYVGYSKGEYFDSIAHMPVLAETRLVDTTDEWRRRRIVEYRAARDELMAQRPGLVDRLEGEVRVAHRHYINAMNARIQCEISAPVRGCATEIAHEASAMQMYHIKTRSRDLQIGEIDTKIKNLISRIEDIESYL